MKNPHLQTTPQIEKIDRVTNWLLAGIIAVPFLISFGALRDLAAKNAITYPLLCPFMIDGGLLIFKALALRESLRGRRDWYTWTMAAALTAVSVILNVVHAPDDILAQVMAALPPALILLAFIAVSRRIEQAAKHEAAVMTLADLDTAVSDKRAEIDSIDDALDAMTAERAALVSDIERLKRQKQTAVSDNGTDKAAPEPVTVDAPGLDGLTDRQRQILTMMKNGRDDKAEIADALGVSERTIYRDINRMNGTVAQMVGGAS
jgi:DNA-binding NarL/FixJ family response regulator